MTHKDLSPHAKADPRQARYEVARRAFQALHGRVIKRMDTNR